MGNKLSMARSEGTGGHKRTSSVLLAKSRPRVSSSTPTGRNKRTKATTTAQKAKRGKAEDTSTESQISAEIENLNGDTNGRPKPKGHRLGNKDRQPDRGAKGKDRTPRRSASELGIEWN